MWNIIDTLMLMLKNKGGMSDIQRIIQALTHSIASFQ